MEKSNVSLNRRKDSEFIKQRFVKSFTAKLSQADGEVRSYYKELKSYILSYTKVNSRISWHYDAFNLGRNPVAKLAIRGKTLCVFLPLENVDKKYIVEKSTSFRFEDTPLLYRIKNDKRCRYARQLIDIVLSNIGAKKGNEVKEIDLPPYEDDDSLFKKGLIKELRG